MEFMAAVTRHPEAAAASVVAQRLHEERIVVLPEKACRRLYIRPAMPLEQIVVVLGALGGSLSLRAAVDPAMGAAAHAAGVMAIMFPESKR